MYPFVSNVNMDSINSKNTDLFVVTFLCAKSIATLTVATDVIYRQGHCRVQERNGCVAKDVTLMKLY